MATQVFKQVLANGLTVLVRPNPVIPKVAIQMWYHVGAKDEQSGEKGLAHLLEHMIFKGTTRLSESDINEITSKLSGYCNAFTSSDYTGYLFDFPTPHWPEALPILADCMTNCTFKSDMLASEMPAVIQELKLYKDNYLATLAEKMSSVIFAGHPYAHPIIGYKHDLWQIDRPALLRFYRKHYVPNNATLVVVGDVTAEQVFALAEQHFGQIPANWDYQRPEYYVPQDLARKSVEIYRDVKQAQVLLAYQIPGLRAQQSYLIDVVSRLIGYGDSSRLVRKFLDELELVTDISAGTEDLFDAGLFFISYQPKNLADIQQINELIQAELDQLAIAGVTAAELQRATKRIEADYYNMLEKNQKQAEVIGHTYLVNSDENALFKYLEGANDPQLGVKVQQFVQQYLGATQRHLGQVLPLAPAAKSHWLALQELSDQEDQRVLAGKIRTTVVEPGVVVHGINTRDYADFKFPRAQVFELSNGLEVLYYHNANTPKIELLLELKADHRYDPAALAGVSTFVYQVLTESTEQHSKAELDELLEQHGMSLQVSAGLIALSLLRGDLELGLKILHELLTQPQFDHRAIEKIRAQILAEIDNYWDTPTSFIEQLAREQVYGSTHPASKPVFGTAETVAQLTPEQLYQFYQQYVVPAGARLAIVGDLSGVQLPALVTEILGSWTGPLVPDLSYPVLTPIRPVTVRYPINRDQVVLALVGNSVSRLDPQYDHLLLFDQIFTGGVLGSMSSRLFALREQTGLF
ncbi:MAG TPA: pitrilysin family protein, partial [Candidatus Babeliales bacterium]|nr:pitrilysin family protein [Candidatus Babeliales bacterium]